MPRLCPDISNGKRNLSLDFTEESLSGKHLLFIEIGLFASVNFAHRFTLRRIHKPQDTLSFDTL